MQTLKKRLLEYITPISVTPISRPKLRTGDRASVRTPPSNTGYDSQVQFTVGLDWLDITFREIESVTELHAILSEAETLLNDQIDFSMSRATYNGRQWQGSGFGIRGTRVYYDSGCANSDVPVRSPQIKIVASGSVVSSVDQSAIAIWLRGRMYKNALDCTRIDVALDDHLRFIDLRKVTEAYISGNFFNSSEGELIISGKRTKDRGVSIYFGAKSSDKRAVFYDKAIESKGRQTGIRLEGRFMRQSARHALYQWIEKSTNEEEDVSKWMQDICIGLVDFRDRSGNDPNRARCPLLPWFAALAAKLCASPARIRVPAPVQTAQKSIEWVKKSVAPTLSLLKAVMKSGFNDFLTTAIADGGTKLSNVRRRLIEDTDSNQLVY